MYNYLGIKFTTTVKTNETFKLKGTNTFNSQFRGRTILDIKRIYAFRQNLYAPALM